MCVCLCLCLYLSVFVRVCPCLSVFVHVFAVAVTRPLCAPYLHCGGHFLQYHVLEHIPSDAQGLREIYRLLRPGGQAMLAVPLDQRLPATKEGGPPPSDRGAQARRYRKREYGQEDHLRIYSIDFADRVRAQGFLVQKIPIQQWMAAVDPNYAKFSNRENKEPTWFAGQEGACVLGRRIS